MMNKTSDNVQGAVEGCSTKKPLESMKKYAKKSFNLSENPLILQLIVLFKLKDTRSLQQKISEKLKNWLKKRR